MANFKIQPSPPPPPPPKPATPAPARAPAPAAPGYTGTSSFQSAAAPAPVALMSGAGAAPVIKANDLLIRATPALPVAPAIDPQRLRMQALLSQLAPTGAVATPSTRPGGYDADAVTRELSRYRYAPEGDGTLAAASIAAMALNGGRPDLGADNALNCVQGAAYAQHLFAHQDPPVETELVVGTNGHAVLRMPGGEYYDPERAMLGLDPMVPESEEHFYDGVDGITTQESAQLGRTATLAYASARAGGASEAEAQQAATDAVTRASGKGRLDEPSAVTPGNGIEIETTANLDGEYKGLKVGVSASYAQSSNKSEPFPTPEGGEAVTYTMESEITFGAQGELSVGAITVGGETYAGISMSYELSVPSDSVAEIDAAIAAGQAPNPIDPTSLPVGGSILITQEELTGTGFSGGLGALSVAAGQESSEGWAFGITRTGPDTVQVVSGPTEAVRQNTFLGVSVGPFSFGFGGETELRNTELQMVEFDISGPEGQAAYQEYLATGQLPDPPPTYPDGRPIIISQGTIDQTDVTSATSIEASIGGFGISIDGRSETMQNRRTELSDGTAYEEAYYTDGEKALHIGAKYDAEGNPVEGPTYTIMLDDVGEDDFEGFSETFPAERGGGARDVEGDQIVVLEFSEQELMELRQQALEQIGNAQEPPWPPEQVATYLDQYPDGLGGEPGPLNLNVPGVNDIVVAIANADTPRDVALALTANGTSSEGVLEALQALSVFATDNFNDPSQWRPLPGHLEFRESTG